MVDRVECAIPKDMERFPEKQRAWVEADVAQLLHELKAPLLRIAADASALLQAGGGGEQALHRIDHSIMILERSIEQLMEINAIESGMLPLNLEPVGLGALVQSAIESYPERARITHRIDREVTVLADPRRLAFGIASLFYAALSCPPRNSRIAVRTAYEGNRATLSVMAPLVGSEPALGLHIASRIARTHGGTTSMRERGGMTSFTMDLPATRSRRQPTLGAILLVDDNLEQVAALAELLREDGFTINYATSGGEALDEIDRRVPDLLIVDIQIPDMDGTEIIRQARQRRPDLPTVLLTGYPPEHPLVVRALSMTRSTYLPKPVNVSELLDIVTHALRA